jgi:hypothetical protein
MHCQITLTVIALLSLVNLSAQESSQALGDFDFLVEKVRVDYAGYAAKANAELATLESSVRQEIAREPERALGLFNKYLSFFDDDHLRVERTSRGNETVVVATTKPSSSLELEGRIMEIHGANHYIIQQSVSPIYDEALRYTYRPRFPNGRNVYQIAHTLSDSTFYMRLPSFNIPKEDVDDLVAKHWAEITSRPNFVIDIRSNPGGRSDVYEALLPLLYTHPYTLKGVEWWAAEGNIADLERDIETDNIREGMEDDARALLREMKRHRGEFVVHPRDVAEWNVAYDTVYPYPRNVGIIIGKENASAAEQFLLTAQNSGKVILFGVEPTAGVLDYSNTVPRPLPSGLFEVWIPQTRSLRLPENPIDATGISPDVKIPFEADYQLYDRLDDWVYFVKNYLELLPQRITETE